MAPATVFQVLIDSNLCLWPVVALLVLILAAIHAFRSYNTGQLHLYSLPKGIQTLIPSIHLQPQKMPNP